MKQRKCHNCQKWTNGEIDFCEYCNHLINPQKILENEINQREEVKLSKRSNFDLYLDRLNDPSKPLKHALYKIVRTFWLIYMGIVTFIIWFIAWMAG